MQPQPIYGHTGPAYGCQAAQFVAASVRLTMQPLGVIQLVPDGLSWLLLPEVLTTC